MAACFLIIALTKGKINVHVALKLGGTEMKFRKKVAADNAGIAQITGFVADHLREAGVSDGQINKSILVVEEAAGCMVQHASEGAGIDVRLRSYFGYVTVLSDQRLLYYILRMNKMSLRRNVRWILKRESGFAG